MTFSLTVFGAIALSVLFAGTSFAQGKGNGRGRGNAGGFDKVFVGSKKDKADKEFHKAGKSNRFKGLSKKLGRSPESLQAWYESERRMNPRLTYGQFVAANMIAKNNRKGISAQTILDGLRNGDSIGQVLHRHGMKEREIHSERDRVRKVVLNDSYRDYKYEDRNEWWQIVKSRL